MPPEDFSQNVLPGNFSAASGFLVCDQRVGSALRLLPTAGDGDQHEGVSLRRLPTTGICVQHLGQAFFSTFQKN